MTPKVSFKKFVSHRGMQFNDNHQRITDALDGCRVTLLNGRYRAIGITTTILNYLAWEAEYAANIPMNMLFLDARPPHKYMLYRMGFREDGYQNHYIIGKRCSLDTATFSVMESKFRGCSQPYDVIVAEEITAKEFFKLFELIQHTTRPERQQYIQFGMEDYFQPKLNPEPVQTFYREPPRIIVSSHQYEPIEEYLISWYNSLNKDEDDQSLALVNEFDDNLNFMNNPNYRPY